MIFDKAFHVRIMLLTPYERAFLDKYCGHFFDEVVTIPMSLCPVTLVGLIFENRKVTASYPFNHYASEDLSGAA